MHPNNNVKLLIINDEKDANDAYQMFSYNPYKEQGIDFFRFLDYEKMAEQYDGIHLTEDGEARTRYMFPMTFCGWDCESTLWFRWKFDKVEKL